MSNRPSSRRYSLSSLATETQTFNLERAADLLLRNASGSPGSHEYPFYTERWLQEMRRREEEGWTPPPALPALGQEGLMELLDLVLETVPLPPRRRSILALVREGFSQADISRRLEMPRQTVHTCLRATCVQILKHWRRHGLPVVLQVHEAFAEQTQRGSCVVERHCREGREACRRDGLCRRRWYLYQEAGH